MTLYLQAALSLYTILLRNFCERSLLYYVLQTISFQLNFISIAKIANLYFFYICIYFNKILNTTRVKTWVKISKVMPQPQVHFPREREGSLTAKGPNLSFKIWYGLTVHIIRF